MKKSKNKESDYRVTPEKNVEDDDDIYKDLGVLYALSVVEKNSFVNPSPDIGKAKDKLKPTTSAKSHDLSPTTITRATSHDLSPTTETPTKTPDDTPTKRTKGSIAARLSLEKPKQTEYEPQQTSPETETTPQTSPAKPNESYKKASQDAGHDTEDNDGEDIKTSKELRVEKNVAKKRKRTESESPGRRTRATLKKQKKEQRVNTSFKKRKRDSKPKKETETSKKVAKKKGKKKLKDEDEDYDIEEKKKDTEVKFKSLRSRATVKPLYQATISLTPERKTIIRQMGFGSMLDFQFDKIPSKLSYFVLKNLNTATMEVSFPNGSKMKITPRKIWEVLGIPMGKNKLESDSPSDDQDEFIRDFKAQFGDKKFITTTDLSKQIQKTTNTDFMFQMNYLMLFTNCIIHCDNSSRLETYVLRNIKSTDVISEFDWCKFIWDVMQTSKVNWKDETLENWYYGPSTVLLFLYLQYTKHEALEMKQCKWPGIRNWTYEDIMERETVEMLTDGIGMVEVLEDDKEENENAKDDERNKLKELIYEVIEEKFQSVLKEKKELEDLLKENLQLHELFSGDEKLRSFVERFKREFIIRGMDIDGNNADTSGGKFSTYNEGTDMTILDRDNFERETNEQEEAEKEAAAKAKEEAEKQKKKKQEEEAATRKIDEEKKAEFEKKKEEMKKKEEKKEQAEAQKKASAERKASTNTEAEKQKKKKQEEEAASRKIDEEKKAEYKKKKEEMKKNEAEKKEQSKAQKKTSAERKASTNTEADVTGKTGIEQSENTEAPEAFESPKSQENMFGQEQDSEDIQKEKRITKKSMYLKSPFMNKMVKAQQKLEKDEILCAFSVFSMQGQMSELVFDDGKGTTITRFDMQTLAPGIEIQKEVIDTLVTVLNYEERIRTAKKALRRLYFPTDTVLLNDEKEFDSFENVIKNQMNASEFKKKMKDVELVFFPTVGSKGQYYVIVFNLLKANAIILDNDKDDSYSKYEDVFKSVKKLLLKYLQKYQHPSVEKLSKDKEPKILKLKWKTEKNKIDSGLYTMMHMEMYQGETASNWKTEIVTESNRDYELQMTNMRIRYTTKILMHEMNTKRGLMSDFANKFKECNKGEGKLKKIVGEGIAKRIAENKKI